MTAIAIMQPMYLPWKGIFDLAQNVEIFVFLDEAQFSRKSTKSRNFIKSPNGLIRLTVPTTSPASRLSIREVQIPSSFWQLKHAKSIEHSYKGLPGFDILEDFSRFAFKSRQWTDLASLNTETTRRLASLLGIRLPEWTFSSSVPRHTQNRTERVIEIAKAFGATKLINGPSARNHLETIQIHAAGISTRFMRYDYPIYDQAFPPFLHEVSILDLIANQGMEAKKYMNGGLD